MNDYLLQFTLYEWVSMGCLLLLFMILLLYLLVVYLRPYRRSKKEKELSPPVSVEPVSVIVYAKNESENLRKHLPLILSQQYAVFEVIVINDGSTDETADLLSEMETRYTNLYHTFIPQESRYLSRKKLALTLGIKAAKHERLLFIEANCRPVSDKWIAAMMRGYRRDDIQIVLGFCSYNSIKGFFHKLVSYDNLITGLQYISSAIGGHPFKGNGRNLSYSKSLFFKYKGFSNSLSLHAGDDDLFINSYATGENTQSVFTPDSFTETDDLERYAVWKEMKVSRAATQRYYRFGSLFKYKLETFFYFLFLLFVLFSVIQVIWGNPIITGVGAGTWLIYYMVKIAIMRKSARLLNQQPLLLSIPLLDICLPVINLYVRCYRVFRGKNDYTFNLPR